MTLGLVFGQGWAQRQYKHFALPMLTPVAVEIQPCGGTPVKNSNAVCFLACVQSGSTCLYTCTTACMMHDSVLSCVYSTVVATTRSQ
jgi:hypothetical protein